MEQYSNIEEIEQYLDGTLKGDALETFKQRLANDKDLANQVELIKTVDQTLGNEKALEVQQTVMDLGADFFPKEEAPTVNIQRSPFYRSPLAMAASFLLLIAFGFMIWWQMKGRSLSNQELFASHYVAYDARNASRGESPDANLYEQAIKQYQSKNYPQAIDALQQFLVEAPQDMLAIYTLAHAYLNRVPTDLEQANTYFQKVVDDGKSIRVAKAKWYQALILLKQEKSNEAKQVLESLLDSEDDKIAQQARALIDQLD